MPSSDLFQRVGPDVDVKTLYQMVLLQQQQIDDLMKNQKQNMDILNGDPTRDLPGLRVRVKEAETVIEEWKRYKLIVKGIGVGMGLTMITSVSTLITLASQVIKVTP